MAQPPLQRSLPFDVTQQRKLPGIQPLDMANWLIFDEAFAGQMARRDNLLAQHREDVLALSPKAQGAAQELLNLVLAQAYPQAGDTVQRADGVRVAIDRDDPLGTVGQLVQQDFCLLEKQGDEHVMTGAVLCFPASWRLSEKFMRPLTDIHIPVSEYSPDIARRVQRLFDGIQPGRPLWRFNALWYHDPELHQPRSIHDRRDAPEARQANYLRSERQSLLRLPQSRAVVFGIHTFVLARADVPGDFAA